MHHCHGEHHTAFVDRDHDFALSQHVHFHFYLSHDIELSHNVDIVHRAGVDDLNRAVDNHQHDQLEHHVGNVYVSDHDVRGYFRGE
ncbi:MAG: hypothetical protein M1118_16200 [Chloroflexi bacterium]|nr:hypothetical protein [Chloroflexota bacterium]